MSLPAVSRQRLSEALAAAGAPPRKRHGQHFLLDDNLLRAIARDARAAPGLTILEIGPGPGLLTRRLLAEGAAVKAIEIDERVEAAARRLIEPELQERLTWVQGDALAGGRTLSPQVESLLPSCDVLASNLPYNVAGPLLGALLAHARCPARLVVMVQREVGDRLLARPGSKAFGSLSVIADISSRREVLRHVPAQAFWPAPRVQSVLTAFELLADRPQPHEYQALEAFLRLAFHSRRKTLVNSVAGASGLTAAETLRRLGSPPALEMLRAEALGSLQLLRLALDWAHNASSGRNRS